MSEELVLIDLSSIAYPAWMTSGSDPDPNSASIKIVARVRSLAEGHPHVAICCDKGRSFRHELSPLYKANRPEREAALHHQIDLAKEQLVADGFPVWAVPSFEADDLIATATRCALELEDLTVLIVSADKDLLQLVGPRVRAMSARDGSVLDAEAVGTKFGVTPAQMRDYLTLVGDASDNIKGAKGIGPKKAAEILAKFGSLDRIYEELAAVGGMAMGLQPAVVVALKEFQPNLETVRKLVTLRSDAAIPFDEIGKPRVPKEVASFGMEEDVARESADVEEIQPTTAPASHVVGAETGEGHQPAVPSGGDIGGTSTAIAVRDAEALAPAPAEWERQLDPRSMRDARLLAKDMYDSRMFSAYGTPHAVLSTVLVGRELGLPAMASLRAVHVIEGKHSLSASIMAALVLKSGLAEFFEPVSFSDTEATYETKRKGARNSIRLTHTIEMARQAWPKTKVDWEKSFAASGWGRNPTDMLVARCQARLARMVYPDLLAGLYTPEELAEIREAVAA